MSAGGFLIEQVYSGSFMRRSNAFDTPEVLTAAAAPYGQLLLSKKVSIKRLMFVVTTVIQSNLINAQVVFKRRPTPGSSTGEILLGTLIIPSGTAVGTVIYKDITPVYLNPGEELAFEQTVQSTDSGTATGQGFYSFDAIAMSESPANSSNMVASA